MLLWREYVRSAEQTAWTVECPGCFASLRSVQGAGLACKLGQRFEVSTGSPRSLATLVRLSQHTLRRK